MAKKKVENIDKENAAALEELVNELPGEEIPLDINPEGDDKIPLDPETGLDPEKLESELNDLKDLVQGEIDKMMEENPDADWKDIVKEAKDEKANRGKSNQKLCECCGENPVDDDEQYCSDCLETMRHYPFEWWKILIPVVAVILVVLAFSYFAISFSVFKSTVSANKLIADGKLSSALSAYDKINAEIKVTDDNFGGRYLRYQVKLYDKIGVDSYEDMSKFIDKYFPGRAIEKKSNKCVKQAKNKVVSYEKLYENLQAVYSEDMTFDKFIKEFENKNFGSDYDKGQENYYKYYAASLFGEDISVLRGFVEKIREVSPNDKSLYLPLLAEVSLNDGKIDDMVNYANELQKWNKESPYAYLYQSIGFRLQGNLPRAIHAANEGLAIESTNTLLNYQVAVINLLDGKLEAAHQYASDAYQYADTQSAYISAASLYSLTSQLLGKNDINAEILSEVSEYGFDISPDVEKIIKGDVTVQDIFTKGQGDFKWAD